MANATARRAMTAVIMSLMAFASRTARRRHTNMLVAARQQPLYRLDLPLRALAGLAQE
jgi:hypothetical protein